MKRFNRILMSVAAAAAYCGVLFTSSCKEDDTLGGAKAVYIEMDQTDISLLVGDTVRLSAHVSNVSGKEIVTSIKWSVDDPSVVDLRELTDWSRKKNSGYVAPPVVEEPDDATEPEEGEEAEGDESGEAAGTPEAGADSEFEADGTPKGTRNPDGTITSPDGRFIYTPSKYWAIIGQPGAQGRTTNLRASLENGKFAMTTVSVKRSSVGGLLEPEQADWSSYYTIKDDVAWFRVDQIGLVDEYDVHFDFEFTPAEGADEGEFIFPEETFRVDRENKLIGMAYIAPRSVGKGTCTITIGNEEESAEASMNILIMPRISGGFEEYDETTGLTRRPLAAGETPSNLKSKNMTKTIDMNSVDSVGVCFYVDGDDIDIANARKAQEAGYLQWTVEGSGILVTQEYFDDYLSGTISAGYVTYIKFTSGSRPGSARLFLSSPARFPEEDESSPYTGAVDFVCDITVADFNTTYPVHGIVLVYDKDTIPEGQAVTVKSSTFDLDVDTDPSESFLYRTPTVTSSAPDVLNLKTSTSENKHIYSFDVLKPGKTTLTFQALDVTRELEVTVNDRVNRLGWAGSPAETLSPGATSPIAVNVFLASNPDMAAAQLPEYITVDWTSSNPQVATVTPDASDPRNATIETLTEGTTTITCIVGGIPYDHVLTVVSRQDAVYTDDNTDTCLIYDNEDGTWLLYIEHGKDVTSVIFTAGSLSGSATGSDAMVELSGDPIEGCSYELSITPGAGTVVINGTVTLPDGTGLTFQNLTVTVG